MSGVVSLRDLSLLPRLGSAARTHYKFNEVVQHSGSGNTRVHPACSFVCACSRGFVLLSFHPHLHVEKKSLFRHQDTRVPLLIVI